MQISSLRVRRDATSADSPFTRPRRRNLASSSAVNAALASFVCAYRRHRAPRRRASTRCRRGAPAKGGSRARRRRNEARAVGAAHPRAGRVVMPIPRPTLSRGRRDRRRDRAGGRAESATGDWSASGRRTHRRWVYLRAAIARRRCCRGRRGRCRRRRRRRRRRCRGSCPSVEHARSDVGHLAPGCARRRRWTSRASTARSEGRFTEEDTRRATFARVMAASTRTAGARDACGRRPALRRVRRHAASNASKSPSAPSRARHVRPDVFGLVQHAFDAKRSVMVVVSAAVARARDGRHAMARCATRARSRATHVIGSRAPSC